MKADEAKRRREEAEAEVLRVANAYVNGAKNAYSKLVAAVFTMRKARAAEAQAVADERGRVR